MKPQGSRQYEIGMVAILCVTFGVVNFDIYSITNLMPFIQPSLKLSNTQIGTVVAGYWIAFAFSSYLTGVVTDRIGRRKAVLLSTLLLFSVFSMLPGFSRSFQSLLAARGLMGLLEGPILPIVQSVVALESSPERRGMNMGIVQSLGSSILGAVLPPLLLVYLSTQYSWRVGFFVVAIPGLICTALIAIFIHEPSKDETIAHNAEASGPIASPGSGAVLRSRNIWLCAVAASLSVAYLIIDASFIPLYYVRIRQFTPQHMSILMSLLGVSGLVFGLVLPAVSDRFGRKPVVIAASALGILCPMAAIYYQGPIGVLAALMFFGGAVTGGSTLFFATIPTESVSTRSISTAIGLIIGLSTLVGGVGGPAIAGWGADHWGLQAALILAAGCAALVTLISFGLRETAPGRKKAVGAGLASTL